MKPVLKTISFLALAGTIALALAFFSDAVSLATVQAGLLLCTVLWFATAPFWMETHL